MKRSLGVVRLLDVAAEPKPELLGSRADIDAFAVLAALFVNEVADAAVLDR